MGLFRNPKRISAVIGRLAFASMIMTIPSLIFGLAYSLGSLSFWIYQIRIVASWIFHATIIGVERYGRRTQYPAYASYPELAAGSFLALGWIAVIIWVAILFWYESDSDASDLSDWARRLRPLAILEFISIIGLAGVMWVLVFFAVMEKRSDSATKLRVTMMPRGNYCEGGMV